MESIKKKITTKIYEENYNHLKECGEISKKLNEIISDYFSGNAEVKTEVVENNITVKNETEIDNLRNELEKIKNFDDKLEELKNIFEIINNNYNELKELIVTISEREEGKKQNNNDEEIEILNQVIKNLKENKPYGYDYINSRKEEIIEKYKLEARIINADKDEYSYFGKMKKLRSIKDDYIFFLQYKNEINERLEIRALYSNYLERHNNK